MATQSLYRRYRPRRFSELKGQDHVVRALRDAVASGREGQAYLFSGPRGTGKTTSARILAKVLNCENVVEGEPCCECEPCLAVERGTSYDVHELDAASNNGVDAIRDLVEKASLGTPGRHKVYILDEVHMLSKAAEAALLKTLEEPPPHVVFVLATTDPQKMSDTIRSRTQHLQFHLLPSDTLAEHIKWVADDAGYDLPQTTLDAALVQGGGSARDTLSALELLASTGGDTSDVIDLDEFLGALIDRDPGRVLTAMGHAVALGRDPRTVTEDLVRHLRNAFLSLMAPELVVMSSDRLDAVATQAHELGAAGLVRAIERLGTALADMRHAPDPRILVEVALVQLTSDQAGGDLDVVAARVERVEHELKELRESGAVGGAPPPARDPATGRAKLGGAARRPAHAAGPPTDQATASPASPVSPAAGDASSDAFPSGASEGAATPAAATTTHAVQAPDAWRDTVKAQLKPLVRALYSAGEFAGRDGDVWLFEVPNEAHAGKCEQHRSDVEAAFAAALGSAVSIRIVSHGAALGGRGATPSNDGSSTAGAPTSDASSTPAAADPSPAPDTEPVAEPDAGPDTQPDTQPETDPNAEPKESAVERAARAAAAADEPEPDAPAYVPEADEDVDLSELTDAPPEAVKTPIDRLAEAFPGSELMADD